MNKIDNPNYFYLELRYNLNELRKTLNKEAAVDLGFIEIFKANIKELKNAGFDKQKVSELSKELKELADKMRVVADRVLDGLNSKQSDSNQRPAAAVYAENDGWEDYSSLEDVHVPLIRPRNSIKSIANEMRGDEILKAGLLKSAETHDVLRIKGDGHCLFRGVAGAFLREIAIAGREYLHRVKERINLLKFEFEGSLYIKERDFISFENILNKLFKDDEPRKNFLGIMSNEQDSNALVAFFRKLACAYTSKTLDDQPNETLFNEVQADGYKDVKAYLNDMIKMEKHKEGGHIELLALAECLKLRLLVVEVSQLGEYTIKQDVIDQDPKQEKRLREGIEHEFAPRDWEHTLHLLRRPGHYDIAIPKG